MNFRRKSMCAPLARWRAGRASAVDEFDQYVSSALALLARDIEMRHGADRAWPERIDEYAAPSGFGDDRMRIRRLVGQPEHDDVGLHRGEIEHHARAQLQTPADQLRMLVIFREARPVVIERVEAGRGEMSHLAHRAARHASIANALLDEALRG